MQANNSKRKGTEKRHLSKSQNLGQSSRGKYLIYEVPEIISSQHSLGWLRESSRVKKPALSV